MSFINKAIRRGFKRPRRRGINEPIDSFTIKLHETDTIIHGLRVDPILGATNGVRNLLVLPAEHRKGSLGNLVGEGGVNWITRKGKKWFTRYSEFSLIFNGREGPQDNEIPFPPQPPTPPKEPEPAALPAAA